MDILSSKGERLAETPASAFFCPECPEVLVDAPMGVGRRQGSRNRIADQLEVGINGE